MAFNESSCLMQQITPVDTRVSCTVRQFGRRKIASKKRAMLVASCLEQRSLRNAGKHATINYRNKFKKAEKLCFALLAM